MVDFQLRNLTTWKVQACVQTRNSTAVAAFSQAAHRTDQDELVRRFHTPDQPIRCCHYFFGGESQNFGIIVWVQFGASLLFPACARRARFTARRQTATSTPATLHGRPPTSCLLPPFLAIGWYPAALCQQNNQRSLAHPRRRKQRARLRVAQVRDCRQVIGLSFLPPSSLASTLRRLWLSTCLSLSPSRPHRLPASDNYCSAFSLVPPQPWRLSTESRANLPSPAFDSPAGPLSPSCPSTTLNVPQSSRPLPRR